VITTSTKHLDKNYCQTNPYKIKPGMYVQLNITDNGIGMDEDTQGKIFEPFFTTKKQGQGTGMGLASVYGTVKNHGGSINVYSELRRGTTVNLYLPQTSSDTLPAKESQMQTGNNSAPHKNIHILLVDDEETIIDIAKITLENAGYKVSTCHNGQEAVDYYKDNWQTINLVILDMIMPQMDGKEAFIEMKKINSKIIALLSSGFAINENTQKILDEGVRDFIQKPYRKHDILQKIINILQ